MSRDRQKRLLRILELITTRAIATQDDLAAALTAEGWDVTQSSVSRDIQALGLVKAGGRYQQLSRKSPTTDPDEARVREGVLMATPAGDHLVVIHTAPGEAQRVGLAIDRLAWAEVVGTVAGDDTIFVAVAKRNDAKGLLRRLRKDARKN
jgi:transcriptional regulator of arginine metabolism